MLAAANAITIDFGIDKHRTKAKGILTVNANDHQALGLFCAPILKSETVSLRKSGTNEDSYGYPLVGDLSLFTEVFCL
jgi:hypothetical protein